MARYKGKHRKPTWTSRQLAGLKAYVLTYIVAS